MTMENNIPNMLLLKAIINDMSILENRKEIVLNLIDFTVKFLTDNQIHSESITRESDGMTLSTDVDIVFIPLILRTSIFVDIPCEEIKHIYNDFKFEYTKAMRDVAKKDCYIGDIDWEAMYVSKYSEKLIMRLQK
jgi:hypothetical protein